MCSYYILYHPNTVWIDSCLKSKIILYGICYSKILTASNIKNIS